MEWWQRWSNVLFLHYAVEAERLQRLMPPGLEVETFEGEAWISYVLFRMKLRPAWMPFLPGFSSLAELNVRTYVRHRGQSGICFLRMYADNPLAIQAARWLTPLDYRPARLAYEELPGGRWRGTCESKADSLQLSFRCGPVSALTRPAKATLDEWLLERYRLYVGGKNGALFAADVGHEPWEAAEMEGEAVGAMGFDEEGASETLALRGMHYSPGVTAMFREFRVLGEAKQFSLALAPRPAHAGGRCDGR